MLDLTTSRARPLPRILFVSSTTAGGSGRSQRELNDALHQVGVATMTLADDGSGHSVSRFLLEQLWDASVRFQSAPILGGSTAWLRSLPGRAATPQGDALITLAPENAFPEVAVDFKPDVVIGTSITRPSWREIRATCERHKIPTILYLREEEALRHLEPGQGSHDAVFANSKTLVNAAGQMGVRPVFIPSVVDLEATRTHSSRERVLLVNPRPEHGVDVVDDLAEQFPTIEFVLQESWELTADERKHVDSILLRRPNVSFRPRTDVRIEIYSDAAIVLAPHKMDNRPRTILEALSNGIPVLCADRPGLVEATGPGGIVIDERLGTTGWCDALERIWQDPKQYREFQEQAIAFSRRDEVRPDVIVDSFLKHVDRALRQSRRDESAA